MVLLVYMDPPALIFKTFDSTISDGLLSPICIFFLYIYYLLPIWLKSKGLRKPFGCFGSTLMKTRFKIQKLVDCCDIACTCSTHASCNLNKQVVSEPMRLIEHDSTYSGCLLHIELTMCSF